MNTRRSRALDRLLATLFCFAFLLLSAPQSVFAQEDVDNPQSSAQYVYLPIIVGNSSPDAQVETPPAAEQDLGDFLLAELARQRNEPAFVAPEAQASAPTDWIRIGSWGSVISWPHVPVSVASLPDGRLLTWASNQKTSFPAGVEFTFASVWNPVTGQFTSVDHPTHDMFCSGLVTLEDGRVVANGGTNNPPTTSTFDYRTNQWQRVESMNFGRWYPGSVALPNGKVLTAVGRGGGQYPEVWTPGIGWTSLNGASLQAPLLNFTTYYQRDWLPYLFVAPDGLVFHSGPTPQMNYINPTGTGSVTNAGTGPSWYLKNGLGILYEQGKLLLTGGMQNATNLAATNQAMVIDINGATAQKTTVAPMNFARKFHYGVILPTGEVMAIGGNTSGVEFSDQGSILAPEIWNPDTQTWRTVAEMAVPRNYHSVAILMTDGRVWSGGGGLCACAADHLDAQIYSPPYLFNTDGSLATRPTISAAPDIVRAGRVFALSASLNINRFTLIKMSATTHNLNSDLRALRLPFTNQGNGQYQLTLNSNVNVLTPGYWMLFALNTAGVPSLAKVMQVVSAGTPLITNPGTQSTFEGNPVNLQIAATDPDGTALTFSASGLPTGLSINSSTGMIAGTASTRGNYRAIVSVSDGGSSASSSFDWSVTPAPLGGQYRYLRLVALSEVANNPWTSAAEVNLLDGNGALINRTGWVVTADSQETTGADNRAVLAVDGNTATIWHTQWQAASPVHPHWLRIDMGTARTIGGLRYLPRQDATMNGTIARFEIYVSTDGNNWGTAVAGGTFANDKSEKSVTIAANRPPIIVQPANQNSLVGATINLPVSASDPDGDPLAYSAGGLPAGLSINASGVIVGTVTSEGSFNVTVTVQDNRGGVANSNFSWIVQSGTLAIDPLVSPPQPTDTAINFVASVRGQNARVKWLFGDGSPETDYSTALNASHSYAQPGLYVVRATVTDDSGGEQSATVVQAIHLPQTGSRPVVSMNIVYEPRSGANNRVWVVNQDNDTVSVFDAVTNAKQGEIVVGSAPRSLAIAADGRIWVVNKGSATISVINPTSLSVAQTINLPFAAQPFAIAFAPNGAAWVTLEATGRLLRLDGSTGVQTGSVDVGLNPRHLSIQSAGGMIFVSRFITSRLPGENTANVQTDMDGLKVGGEVVMVDAAALTINKTIVLQHSEQPDADANGRGIPNYLGPAVIAPDGVSAWVPSKQDNIRRGTLRDGNNLNFQNTIRAISSRIDLANGALEDAIARLDHDNAGVASTGLFDQSGSYLFVALETNREIAVIDAYGKTELFRIAVGRAPQGIALSPDGLRLYVNNFMDRSVSVLDLSRLINHGERSVPVLATLGALASEKLSAQVLSGKQFFYDAKDTRMARDSYISCAGCHNDGGQDGRVWDFTGVGEGLRNTISLRGRSGMGQGFLHWSSNFDEVQDFEGQIRVLAGGSGLMSDAAFSTGTRNTPLGDRKSGVSADLDALAAYVASLTSSAPSPYRNPDGSLTSEGAAGKTVFQNANCAQCHTGSAFTDSSTNLLRNVGTLKLGSGGRLGGSLSGIDTPTLRDVWATAPYLHDGSAATLNEAVRAHSGVTINGSAISDSDLTLLVAYLRQIGNHELDAPVNLGSGTILRQWWTGITGAAVSNLTSAPAYPNSPSGSNQLTSFEAPTNWADNYGTRVRGYVHAPVTGNYRFWIASDDASQLLLSSSDNPANVTGVASVAAWTNSREWGKYASQQSGLILLQAGQKYYIEALQKEAGGGDNLAVSWQIPGGVQAVIEGKYLSPIQVTAPTTQRLWIEAESGILGSPLQNLSNGSASNGRFIQVAAGNNSTNAAPSNGNAVYSFSVANSGSYKIWGRTIAATGSDDSFWVQVDGGVWYKWNGIPLTTAWAWDDVHNGDAGNVTLTWNLAAGAHTLRVAYREDGTQLDRILITNEASFVPSGVGGN